jgi:transposase
LERAFEQIARAKTLEQLRQAQAVALPLVLGLSLEKTAQLIGHSTNWTCRLRNRFLKGDVVDDQCLSPGGRRHQLMNAEQEREILESIVERARADGSLVVSQVRAELEARLGHPIGLSTVYTLLHRHGWRRNQTLRDFDLSALFPAIPASNNAFGDST